MKILYSLIITLVPLISSAQDTFSICAYDSITGQVGSAGATCIQAATSAIIISDVVPGKGVVHTQAAFIQANRTYAHSLLLLGLPPQQIIDSVTLHDVQGDSTVRQYGVVDVHGASAAFTGTNCMDYKNHITGPGYSIQGNILLGQQILDSMESRFLNTPGDLACRLMAALQGAKVVGADTRCTTLGISSVSAFIRVGQPGDTATTPLSLSISVNTYPNYKEPIDSLQVRFDLWGGCNSLYTDARGVNNYFHIYPNPASRLVTVSSNAEYFQNRISDAEIFIRNIIGEKIISSSITSSTHSQLRAEIDVSTLNAGIYFVEIKGKDFTETKKLVIQN